MVRSVVELGGEGGRGRDGREEGGEKRERRRGKRERRKGGETISKTAMTRREIIFKEIISINSNLTNYTNYGGCGYNTPLV